MVTRPVRISIKDEVVQLFSADQLMAEKALPGAKERLEALEELFRLPASVVDLAEVGKDLYRWLDGPAHWLEAVCSNSPVFLFQIEGRLGLLPWELLRGGEGFLAVQADPVMPYRTVLSRRPSERDCANRPLRVLFAACAPESLEPVHHFENEEALILAATQDLGIERIVESSGSLEGLAAYLADYGAGYFDVLHLSGRFTQHGFQMEDLSGEASMVIPEKLAQALAFKWPALVFLSGVKGDLSLDQGALPSFMEVLVRAGAPLVLGWSQPYDENAAGLVAWELYGRLAEGQELGRAIAATRGRLLAERSPFWHMLRCYGDGTPLAALVTPPHTEGRAELSQVPAGKRFSAAGARVGARASEFFIGRRRALQRCHKRMVALPDMEDTYCEGLQVTGMGGLGKTSLAMRLCAQVPDLQHLVWVGRLSELDLLAKLSLELREPQRDAILFDTNQPLRQRLKTLFDRYDLRLCFVFDDFEQNARVNAEGSLRFDSQGLMLVQDEPNAILRDLLEAIRETASPSRVVLTCRYAIVPPSTLARLYNEPLAHLRGADLTKKLLQLPGFSKPNGDADMVDKARRLADGNPRLLEILDGVLRQNMLADAERAALLAQLASAAEAFREQILLTGLLALIPSEHRVFLAKIALCQLPVPQAIVEALDPPGAQAVALEQAANLGLLERVLGQDGQITLYVSELLKPMLDEVLSEDLRTNTHLCFAAHMARWDWANIDKYGYEYPRELWRHALSAGLSDLAFETAVRLAGWLLVRNRYRDAREFCQTSLTLGQDPRILVMLGRIQMVLGETDAAHGHLMAALDQREHWDSDENLLALCLYNLAQLALGAGDMERSLELWTQALDLYDRIPDLHGKAATLANIAWVKCELGDVDEGLALWEQSLELKAMIGDEKGRAASLANKATVHAQRGELDEALKLWGQSLSLMEKVDEFKVAELKDKANTLNVMALALAQRGEITKAQALWQEALAIHEQGGDHKGKSSVLHQMAGFYAQRGEVERALNYWRESLALDEHRKDRKGQAATLANMASVVAQQGDVQEAIAIWQASYELDEAVHHQRGMAATLHQMAEAVIRSGEVERGLSLLKESLAINRELKDHRTSAISLANIAGVFALRGDIDRALELWQESLAQNEAIADVQCRARTLHNMAGALQQKGDVTRAELLWQESLALSKRIEDLKGMALTLNSLGGVAVRSGETARAEQLFEEALALFERLADVQGKAAVLGQMALIIYKSGDLERASHLWQENLDIVLKVGDVEGQAVALLNLAGVARRQNQIEQAISLNLQALQAFGKMNAWLDVHLVLNNLSLCSPRPNLLALYQALWVILRIQSPIEDIFHTTHALLHHPGLDPRLAPLIGAVMFYKVQTVSPNHPKLAQFREDAIHAMLIQIPIEEQTQEGIQAWMNRHECHDPALFAPRLDALLLELIPENQWYFDRRGLA